MSKPKKTITYVVQVKTHLSDEEGTVWLDLATVEVPSGSKRKTILLKALAETDVVIPDKPSLRALDAESFEVFEPEAVQPPMEWRLPS